MWINLNIPLLIKTFFDIMNMFSVVDTLVFQQFYQQPVDIFVNNLQGLCIIWLSAFCILWIAPTTFRFFQQGRGLRHTGYFFKGVNRLWKAILTTSGSMYYPYCKKG
ncbi:hypothetical protein ACVLD2_003467 [Paenibacillus sp. PvR052]|nr:hypothetical protein [Paenibacillus sp. PvP091]MBP1171366.1 hypothetical protein [Paenibacillus sp. PvR098]MBP2442394.1 hypothetical protein [Paenibacillus sp. PvP052]